MSDLLADHEDAPSPEPDPQGKVKRGNGTLRSVLGSPITMIGVVLILLHVVMAVAAPWFAPYSPIATSPLDAITDPTAAHWLGTDQLGRDVLSRVIYGGRNAMLISVAAAILSVGIGTALGCAAAYFRGWFDETLMRILDAVLSVPAILALLVVVSVLGAGSPVIILAATVVYCPAAIRVIRAGAQSVVGLDYVTAARARGENPWSTMVREILPNVLDVILVEFAMRASWIVLLVSSLSFLGFGANPPTPDWGLMVSESRSLLTVTPWAAIGPIIALATLIVGLNLAADGLAKARGIDRVTGGA